MSGNPTLQAKTVHNADIKTYEGHWNIVMKPRSQYAAGTPIHTMASILDEGHHTYSVAQPHIQVASTETVREENLRLRALLKEKA